MPINDWTASLLSGLTQKMQQAMSHPGSLTHFLKNHFPNFSVQVLGEQDEPPSTDELAILGLSEGMLAKIRTVYLCSNLVPLVFARTVVPQTLWQDERIKLYGLGNAPLGQILFDPKNPAMRGAFQFAELDYSYFNSYSVKPGCELFKKQAMLPARRSIFSWHQYEQGQRLLVTEVFLPAFITNLSC